MRLLLIGICIIAGLAGVWSVSKSQTFQIFGEAIARVETENMVVALTFDDGPSRKHTAAVLDILAEKDAVATFFLTGHEAAANLDLVRNILQGGHDVGNHSFSHDRLILKSSARIRDELAKTDAILQEAGATLPNPFRPPYGQKLLVLPWVLNDGNRPSVMWDVAVEYTEQTPQDLADQVIAETSAGSIILMHVMYDSRATERMALPLIIDGLRAQGFELVTVPALLQLHDAP